MKTISIAVLMKDTVLEDILAEELAAVMPGLIVSRKEKADVLVTDYDDTDYDLFSGISEKIAVCRVDERNLDLSEIAARIVDSAALSRGEVFEQSQTDSQRRIKVIGFRSEGGGSGVTSVSLTAARLLNALARRRTLFINMAENNGFRLFCGCGGEAEGQPLRSIRELAFCLREGYAVSVKAFLTYDEESLEILDCGGKGDWNNIFEEKFEDFLHVNCRVEGYDYVVVDLGSGQVQWCDKIITVLREGDLRTECWMESKEGQYEIYWNKTDRESFKVRYGGIKISMNGNFADDIRAFINELINTEGC